jgi:hypothetical protein
MQLDAGSRSGSHFETKHTCNFELDTTLGMIQPVSFAAAALSSGKINAEAQQLKLPMAKRIAVGVVDVYASSTY